MSIIQSNLLTISSQIRKLGGKAVQLVAVSKTKSVEDIRACYDAGHRSFGENYVIELTQKAPALPSDIRWHFIGHLQSNKVHKLITSCPNLYMIETIDSEKLATKVNLALEMTGRPDSRLRVLIEVKTSQEESKHGVAPTEVLPLIAFIRDKCPRLIFSGLMTMASPERPGECFSALRGLADELGEDGHEVETLSMGMSGDFELAIQHGSTEVRIGSSIFGSR